MLTFDFLIPGDSVSQIRTGFARAGLRVKDLQPAWGTIHRFLEGVSKEQFASEGARGSGGWAPLSPAYAERKARRWGTRPILQASGRMHAGLTSASSPDAVRVSKPLEMRFGVRLPKDYAKFHQSGTSRMPRRRPIELTATDRRHVEKVIAEAIRDEFLAGRRAPA